MRRRPEPAPAGWHWEVGARKTTAGIAAYWLVEDGMRVDDVGFYLERPTDRIPMPTYSCEITKESRIRTETRRLLQRREADLARASNLVRLQERTTREQP